MVVGVDEMLMLDGHAVVIGSGSSSGLDRPGTGMVGGLPDGLVQVG
jgi:hypothetical protein